MFIWTVSDAIGVVFWGLVILFFGLLFAAYGIEKLWLKLKRTFGRAHQ
jgi:hypothetical protein